MALDVSPLAAQIRRRGGVRQVMTGAVSDLRARGAGPFDPSLALGNNLGLLGGARGARALLGALDESAAPGAVIIGQGVDPYRTGNPPHLAYHERDRAPGRVPGQIGMRVRREDLATPWLDYLFTGVEEPGALPGGSSRRPERRETGGAGYVALLRLSARPDLLLGDRPSVGQRAAGGHAPAGEVR